MAVKSAGSAGKPRPNTTAAAGKPQNRLSRQNAAVAQAMDARFGTKGKSAVVSKGGPGKKAR